MRAFPKYLNGHDEQAVWLSTALNVRNRKRGKTLQYTDHELIPTRNASLAEMQGSASENNIPYYPT
jgi:hypothetical protein